MITHKRFISFHAPSGMAADRIIVGLGKEYKSNNESSHTDNLDDRETDVSVWKILRG